MTKLSLYQSREEIEQLLLEFNNARCFWHLTPTEQSVVLRAVIASDVFDIDDDLWPAREYCDEHAQKLTDWLSDAVQVQSILGTTGQSIAYQALSKLLVDTVLDNVIDKIDAIFAEVHCD